MAIDRRNLDEIRARYVLEPYLRDIYVEGQFDLDMMNACIRYLGLRDVVAYSIDGIDVPDSLLIRNKLTSGRKQRQIALSRELNLPQNTGVRVLVDRDFDHWLNCMESRPGLVWTTFCDMESYFFDEAFLKSIFLDAASAKVNDWSELWNSLKAVVRLVYSLRFVLKLQSVNFELMDFTRCLALSNDTISLDFDTFITRALSGKVERDRIAELKESALEKSKEWASASHQLTCRGHDFLEVVAWAVRKLRGRPPFEHAEHLSRVLVSHAGGKSKEIFAAVGH